MQSKFELHDGLAALEQIARELPPESEFWNEAQNRFQLIDRLLLECLGWDHAHMEVENTDEGGGRADYLLGKPVKAILEAKREASEWHFPPGKKSDVPSSIESAVASCKNFKKVVTQVIPYCSLRGVPIAIVSNGKQLVIFQAVTVGESPFKGRCYIFDGLQDYISRFHTLWEFLSPEGLLENKVYQKFSQLRSPRMPAKASTAIPEPNKYRYRDDLQEGLQLIGSLLLEEIEDNPETREEFYNECYVPLEANNRHLILSKKIIERRYRRAGDGAASPASLEASSVDELVGAASAHIGSKPIIVLGDVGVGKSSFFENLHLSTSKASKNSIYITINLGVSANLTNSVKEFVLKSIPVTLRKNYEIDIFDKEFVEFVYKQELIDFERRAESDLKEIDINIFKLKRIEFIESLTKSSDLHLHASIEYIFRKQSRQITLVIDNADQRNYPIQQEAFLIAQELAATRNLNVFVALRPSTFFASKSSGALSAYQNKILSISPPPIDEVILKRIAFALRVAKGKAAPVALDGIRLNLNNVVLFLSATLRSVKSNNDLKQFLSNISGGNTRAVIELITAFCGSPNVDCRKIIKIENETGNYKVPLHEFTKHSLLGEYSYYNPESSQLATNLFDLTHANEREHFLIPLIVAFLSSNQGIKDNDGFFFGEDVRGEFQRLGFLDEQISQALRRAAVGRLLETPHSHFREIPIKENDSPFGFNYRATSIGIYHIRYWCGSFAFLDAMSTDTPILNDSDRKIIFGLASSFAIKDRLRKATTFRSYLENCWNSAAFSVNYYDFRAITEVNSRDFDSIERLVLSGKRGPT